MKYLLGWRRHREIFAVLNRDESHIFTLAVHMEITAGMKQLGHESESGALPGLPDCATGVLVLSMVLSIAQDYLFHSKGVGKKWQGY